MSHSSRMVLCSFPTNLRVRSTRSRTSGRRRLEYGSRCLAASQSRAFVLAPARIWVQALPLWAAHAAGTLCSVVGNERTPRGGGVARGTADTHSGAPDLTLL